MGDRHCPGDIETLRKTTKSVETDAFGMFRNFTYSSVRHTYELQLGFSRSIIVVVETGRRGIGFPSDHREIRCEKIKRKNPRNSSVDTVRYSAVQTRTVINRFLTFRKHTCATRPCANNNRCTSPSRPDDKPATGRQRRGRPIAVIIDFSAAT